MMKSRNVKSNNDILRLSSSFRSDSVSSGGRYDNFDEETALQWAAIERLPTYKRLRSSLFDEPCDSEAEVRKYDKWIMVSIDFNRAGIELPPVEVRYHDLHVETECEVVDGKPLPTLWNSLKVVFWEEKDLTRLPGLKSRLSNITIIDGVNGIIKPGRMTFLLGPPGYGKTTLLKALSGNLNKSLKLGLPEPDCDEPSGPVSNDMPPRPAKGVDDNDWNGMVSCNPVSGSGSSSYSCSCSGSGDLTLNDQQSLFNILGSMFSAIFFCGVYNTSSILPFVSTERAVLYRQRFAGMYASWAYAVSQVVIEIPCNIVLAMALYFQVLLLRSPMSFSKVFWYIYSMFCTLLSYNCLGMMIVSITPSFPLAAILRSAFSNILYLFVGFLIPRPQIPKWWVWLYYLTPTSWTLNGMFTSQYGDINRPIKQIPKWWIWLIPSSWTLNGLLNSQCGDVNEEIMVFDESTTPAAFIQAYYRF
ncbi:hypothetical protein ACH5RR_022786 [Cinchona calisaya]|uniref:AAA+ ATPase domain-containing protein n=1 Tax=Cinchona calisaya TaxID=153742 RepID=A0ABD2Z9W5_9GENT